MAASGERLSVWLDDEGHAYPLAVDPLLTSPSWTAESDHGSWKESSARFGLAAGDAGYAVAMAMATWWWGPRRAGRRRPPTIPFSNRGHSSAGGWARRVLWA